MESEPNSACNHTEKSKNQEEPTQSMTWTDETPTFHVAVSILLRLGSLLQRGNEKKKRKEEDFPRHPVVQQLPINSTSVPPPPPWGGDSPSGSRRTNIRRRCLLCCCCFLGWKSKGAAHFSSASQPYFLPCQRDSEPGGSKPPTGACYLLRGGAGVGGGGRTGGVVDRSPIFLPDHVLLILCGWVTTWNAAGSPQGHRSERSASCSLVDWIICTILISKHKMFPRWSEDCSEHSTSFLEWKILPPLISSDPNSNTFVANKQLRKAFRPKNKSFCLGSNNNILLGQYLDIFDNPAHKTRRSSSLKTLAPHVLPIF